MIHVYICGVCNKEFEDKYNKRKYCSLSCGNVARYANNERLYLAGSPRQCKGCEKPVTYKGRFHNAFCSSSCAAVYNNARREKKIVERFCSSCGIARKRSRNTLCRICSIIKEVEAYGEKCLVEFNSTYARHRYQLVRYHAHRVAEFIAKFVKKCAICEYDRHVELAHKKPISSFCKETKLNEINSLDNLVYLCPNHHWELDSGILKF
jgi:hypothetical protein